MKTILITGANKGIGFETAKQLAKLDFQVIITGRNEGRLSAALAELQQINKSAQMLVMDVSKTESIAQAVETLTEKDIQLDVLINNAGIIEDKDRSILNKDFSVFENTMNTNAHGALKVAVSFLLLMKKPSKIINISSSGGSMSEPVGGWSPAYCVSKSMLNAITRHLSFELKSRSIAVNAVCPGWVQTDMGGDSAIRPVEKGAETPVWLASEASQKITGKFFRDKKEIDW